jgi:hypothetical protein
MVAVKEATMGLLGKIFSKDDKDNNEMSGVTMQVECPHAVLTPRWDSVDDMGKEDKVTRYICEGCQETFTPEEAAMLRDSVSERLVGQEESINS